MEKSIRFGDLVRNSGRPYLVTLWTDPKKDPSLQQAIEKNRVLTVIQEPSAKHKDYAIIGFHQEPHASYLVFPRPLPADKKSRVIGINYHLLEEPEVTDAVQIKELKPKREVAKPKPAKKTFTVKVRRTAVLEKEARVEAENQESAEEQALESVKKRPFKLREAALSEEIVKTD